LPMGASASALTNGVSAVTNNAAAALTNGVSDSVSAVTTGVSDSAAAVTTGVSDSVSAITDGVSENAPTKKWAQVKTPYLNRGTQKLGGRPKPGGGRGGLTLRARR